MLCKSWRKLPGVEGDLTTILVYIPAETAAVLTLARVAKQPKICVCVCARVYIPEEKASSGGHGVRAPKQTEPQPLGRENKIEIERLRA